MKRLIKKIEPGIKIYWCSDWEEYTVETGTDPDGHYHTDDKDDALDTAAYIAKSLAA